MKNLHILPTDKPSRLYKNLLTDKLFILENSFMDVSECNREYQNIYITSNEEIKDGDWFLCLNNRKCNDSIYKANEAWLNMEEKQPSYCKKIILTDNKDLIKDGVQAIDDEFLEWFVKNPSCEYVEVYKDKRLEIEQDFNFYEIIIPKEEPNYNMKKEILIEMMKQDKELGLYEETVEEYFLSSIKNMLQFNNDALAIRLMEKYYHAKKQQDEK